MDYTLQWLRLYAQLVLLSRWVTRHNLAAPSIEPDELFAFMRGELADRFVRTAPEISDALDRVDGDCFYPSTPVR